jgi:hypothetical protein
VDPSTLDVVRAAEAAVNPLVEVCRKGGPVYASSPRAAAQVNRTAKWLINALAALRKAPDERGAGQNGRHGS